MSSCCRAKWPCFILAKVLHLKNPLLPSDSHVIIFTSVCTITNLLETANSYKNSLSSELETAVLCLALVLAPPLYDPQSWVFLPCVIGARSKGSLEWGPGACCVPTLSIPKAAARCQNTLLLLADCCAPQSKGRKQGRKAASKASPLHKAGSPTDMFVGL